MTRKLTPIEIEGWPLPPISVWQSQLHRSRILSYKGNEPNCILGNPDFACRLLTWLQDIQEDLCLQVWLCYDPEAQSLQTHLRLEIEGLEHGKISEWDQDIDTLIELNDPKSEWGNPVLDTNWEHGILLQILEQSEEEADFQPNHLHELFRLLEHRAEKTAIVLSLSFKWENHSIGIPARLRRRRPVRRINRLIRAARRRIAILSNEPVTSLLRQSTFRAFAGTGHRHGRWHALSTDMLSNMIRGPLAAFADRPNKSFTDRVTLSELRDALTANLVPHEVHHDDIIPF